MCEGGPASPFSLRLRRGLLAVGVGALLVRLSNAGLRGGFGTGQVIDSAGQNLLERLVWAGRIWSAMPGDMWRLLWPMALMTASVYPLLTLWRVVRERLESRLDRWLLACLTGMAFYTLAPILLNALFGSPINEVSHFSRV